MERLAVAGKKTPFPGAYVYVMEGACECKVGVSKAPKKRLRELKIDGAVGIVKTWHRPDDASSVERAAHAILLNGDVRFGGRGEWFRVTPEVACEAVEQAIASKSCPKVRRWRAPEWSEADRLKMERLLRFERE
jgi:hypothetical protein